VKALLVIATLAGCSALTYEPDVGALQAPDAAVALDDAGGDGGATQPGRCSDSSPITSVSFARDIRPLFAKSPGGCSCHASNATGGFNLGSYESLRRGGTIGGTQIIVPGKPCESVLFQKLGLAPPFGARMPYNGPPFYSAAELGLVRDWIAEGAANN